MAGQSGSIQGRGSRASQMTRVPDDESTCAEKAVTQRRRPTGPTWRRQTRLVRSAGLDAGPTAVEDGEARNSKPFEPVLAASDRRRVQSPWPTGDLGAVGARGDVRAAPCAGRSRRVETRQSGREDAGGWR